MNKTIYTVLLTFFFFSLYAQEKDTSSTEISIEGRNVKIVISEKKDSSNTTKSNTEEDYEEPEKTKLLYTNYNQFHLGFNDLINAKNKLESDPNFKEMSLEQAKSINFQWTFITQHLNLYEKKVFLNYGLGIDYNNYRLRNDIDLVEGSEQVTYTINEDRDYIKNKLVSQYLTVPLNVSLRLKSKKHEEAFYLAAGINAGYLIRSHQKQIWDAPGKVKSKNRGDFDFLPFRIGYEVQIGFDRVVVYGKYYPESIFSDPNSPNLKMAAVGIVINVGPNSI